MQFAAEMSGKDFAAVIGRCARGAATRSKIPIIGHALFRAVGGALRVTTTNLDVSLSALVQCQAEGAVTASVTRLSAIAAVIDKAAPVRLATDGGGLTISQGRSRHKLPTLPIEDFPSARDVSKAPLSFDVPASELERSLADLAPAMSNEPTRYYLCGIYFDTANGVLAATNSHILGVDQAPWCKSAKAGGFVLPADSAELVRAMCRHGDTVRVSATPTAGEFMCGEMTLVTKWIDGSFPDYRRVIPNKDKCDAHVTLKCADLLAAMPVLGAVGRDNSGMTAIAVAVKGREMQLSCRTDGASAETSLPCEVRRGAWAALGCNLQYLKWAADSLGDVEAIDIYASGHNGPMLLAAVGGDGAERVVMPRRA